MSASTTLDRPIVIAAGGTGGHFFPAEALAAELRARGHRLVLMTDARAGRRNQGVFAEAEQHVLPGAGVAGRGLAGKLRSAAALLRGALEARRLMRRIGPAVVVGFGGYPSVPPLLGARLLGAGKAGIGRPALVLHEGNAVLGQANALLARFADVVATSFPTVARLPATRRTVLTGMPVRPELAALAGAPLAPTDGALRLLIWGGSLGARVFSDVVPPVLTGLPPELRARLRITQQARAEDVERVRTAYAAAGIEAEVQPFFHDVSTLLRDAHLVIGRAGGSSVAELGLVGRPAIMVPLPIAASDEQTANARALSDAGGGWLLPQPSFTPDALATLLRRLLTEPDALRDAAARAGSQGRPDAARRLADLVEELLQPRTQNDREPGLPPRAPHVIPSTGEDGRIAGRQGGAKIMTEAAR
ncbi:undecaprenyldiphospho-muramoylpentapeptide beta-N-acetylglucosaminyltransferase [Rhizosaccharibacter radicis]|uniref:UDP-N-acetylglucosamine--N-acetylmuramyl-(pentapeptide) pyrophosphoryl-undecaprenol N-acetylglucosamine transferase n=1 Tax=Rhizosaccharibacter radicis TaxID=2782605 RepID=A0ABT1VY50_9PROT|nr:undecaprenyldiphospho-muramoylpentapeptide beta-N-acetylglucosaminyltransferase [Acetobacteraceae bacterium KSS12]